jgi:hypothetical protein
MSKIAWNGRKIGNIEAMIHLPNFKILAQQIIPTVDKHVTKMNNEHKGSHTDGESNGGIKRQEELEYFRRLYFSPFRSIRCILTKLRR